MFSVLDIFFTRDAVLSFYTTYDIILPVLDIFFFQPHPHKKANGRSPVAISLCRDIKYEPLHENTNNLHMRKQSRRSAVVNDSFSTGICIKSLKSV